MDNVHVFRLSYDIINHVVFSNDLEENAASEQAYDFMPMKINEKNLRKFAKVRTDSTVNLRTKEQRTPSDS